MWDASKMISFIMTHVSTFTKHTCMAPGEIAGVLVIALPMQLAISSALLHGTPRHTKRVFL